MPVFSSKTAVRSAGRGGRVERRRHRPVTARWRRRSTRPPRPALRTAVFDEKTGIDPAAHPAVADLAPDRSAYLAARTDGNDAARIGGDGPDHVVLRARA